MRYARSFLTWDFRRIFSALGPGQTINVWRPTTIKHCVVTKHANVEASGQTVKICLIKHRSNKRYRPQSKRGTHQTCLIRGCPNEQNIAHQTREQKTCFTFLIECLMAFKFYETWPNTIRQDKTRSNSIKQGVQTVKCLVTKQCLMVFGRQTFIVCPGPYAR